MAVDLFTTDQSFSIAKARSDLGYAPRLDFAGSLPAMVRWLEGGSPWSA
jgi:nucleoside-diphosphate-sugar epimerase